MMAACRDGGSTKLVTWPGGGGAAGIVARAAAGSISVLLVITQSTTNGKSYLGNEDKARNPAKREIWTSKQPDVSL